MNGGGRRTSEPAAHNHERLWTAARAVLAERGLQGSIQEFNRRAGIGA